MSESMQGSRPILAWMEVLDRIERSLEQSLALASELPEVPIQTQGAGAAALQLLDTRLARWQMRLDQASQNAQQIDALAAAEEAALGELIPRLKAARERLASHAKRPA